MGPIYTFLLSFKPGLALSSNFLPAKIASPEAENLPLKQVGVGSGAGPRGESQRTGTGKSETTTQEGICR